MTWWHYLLLVNFYLVLFFGFYALLLRRETFFQLNRIYLVGASLLSFTIPLIQADWVKNLFITQEVQHTVYNIPVGIPLIFTPAVESGITLGEVLNIVYISVTLFLLIRLMWQLLVLKKAIEKPTPSAAYTFFKKISLGENMAQSKIIADHEQVHAGQWHSIDVMIIETVMIINWFNPVVYLYRFAIKYTHEFIADSQVIKAGTDKADYALLLLSQTFDVSANNLVNQFYNHSLLKQRIMMLQKNKSQRIALAKYGLSAPLFILMMIFSSATINNSKAVAAINNKATKVVAASTDDLIDAVTNRSKIPTEKKIFEYQVVKTEKSRGNITISVDTLPIYKQVDQQPNFPGGLESFGKFLGNNIKYPEVDQIEKREGKVFVTFVVEPDGSLSEIKAIRGPSQAMMDEAIRVLLKSPKWQPGYQKGKPVRVSYTLPIQFIAKKEGEASGATIDDKGNIVGKNGKFIPSTSPLYLIDGVVTDITKNDKGEVVSPLSIIPQADILSMEILKDKTAEALYGDRGKYGVILVTTKNGKTETVAPVIKVEVAGIRGGNLGKIMTPTSPLYVIDGVIATVKTNDKGVGVSPLNKIPQENIASIEILKDQTATAIYGDKGKYGVIIITTKNPKKG